VSRRTASDSSLSLRARPFVDADNGGEVRLLTDKQRRELLGIATKIEVPARGIVYREHTHSSSVFICGDGALKAFRDLPSGRRHIVAFMFRGDMFGLAESGRYVNTVQATMPTVCYRLPLGPLLGVIMQDPQMQFSFLCKVTHELRESQRRAIIVARRAAAGRLAMFLRLLEKSPVARSSDDEIPIPVSRSDIAAYLNLTLESVSRACRELDRAGIVTFESRHTAHVADRRRFTKIAAEV
jgi:CRP-like cAMP-binding protein